MAITDKEAFKDKKLRGATLKISVSSLAGEMAIVSYIWYNNICVRI